jgi:predicted DNA-binding transcriptional regulator AlpA
MHRQRRDHSFNTGFTEKIDSVPQRQAQVLVIDQHSRAVASSPVRHILAYQNLNARQLAERFGVPHTWILENSKVHMCPDPIPHIHLGKHKRYRWGSPDIAEWIERRVVNPYAPSSAGSLDATYEFLDSAQLAARLNISESWVRERIRTRACEPIPHVRLGKYVRFRWGSPELESWAECRMLSGNNRTVGRAQGKEQVQ